jgi:hypothetical protein
MALLIVCYDLLCGSNLAEICSHFSVALTFLVICYDFLVFYVHAPPVIYGLSFIFALFIFMFML